MPGTLPNHSVCPRRAVCNDFRHCICLRRASGLRQKSPSSCRFRSRFTPPTATPRLRRASDPPAGRLVVDRGHRCLRRTGRCSLRLRRRPWRSFEARRGCSPSIAPRCCPSGRADCRSWLAYTATIAAPTLAQRWDTVSDREVRRLAERQGAERRRALMERLLGRADEFAAAALRQAKKRRGREISTLAWPAEQFSPALYVNASTARPEWPPVYYRYRLRADAQAARAAGASALSDVAISPRRLMTWSISIGTAHRTG